ncbi:bifunctional diguanylate cyclase/phosphodiesterase [Aurantimonas sp. A2-1-M11]|uniref:putative bifunctional diguanylate cyclase/phosphodiesterase n=1 Tax=Aurantimonas sp. A2-1-M11 TaxID=3113712 RepID=UPI002F953551
MSQFRDPRTTMRLGHASMLGWLLAILGLAALGLFEADGEDPLMTRILAAMAVVAVIALASACWQHRLEIELFRQKAVTDRQNAQIHERDAATGALTRRVFISRCGERLKSVPGSGGHALLLIDLDHLKQINDAYGHDMGDAALRHLASVAGRLFPGSIIGRVGGDEFALLTQCASPIGATRLAGRFLSELDRTVYHSGRPMNLSASIGIACACACGDTALFDDLMQYADLALYQSKRNGRAQATLFESEMLRDQKHIRYIERELRAAILLNELELAYQPIVRVDGTLHGLEALVRWRHPLRGVIPPVDFVPIAEQSMLIDLLGEWVFRRACRDGMGAGSLSIGVNFSASQLKRDDVVAMVDRVLAETGMPASRIVIEITESVAMNANEHVIRRLTALRALGVRISLDDFGTGFCGFSYLRTFPIDSLKIDRSFVARLGDSEAENVLITALASVANAMGLSLVAEGIETAEQMVLATTAGCRLLQGYHIARPQPWSDIETMLAGEGAIVSTKAAAA